MMAAQLQIFMTNPASHCKGMWNLCVILALKNNLFCVDAAPKHMSPSFDKQSHGSNGHPDLNMSEFSRLATKKGRVFRESC